MTQEDYGIIESIETAKISQISSHHEESVNEEQRSLDIIPVQQPRRTKAHRKLQNSERDSSHNTDNRSGELKSVVLLITSGSSNPTITYPYAFQQRFQKKTVQRTKIDLNEEKEEESKSPIKQVYEGKQTVLPKKSLSNE